MKIISESYSETRVSITREFQSNDCPGAGYSFDLNEDETPILKWPEARRNWEGCITGEFDVTDLGVVRREYEVRHPRIGKCDCGREVVLDSFTCPCDCGRDYNSAGQLLAPRDQWGEETGESLSDILRIP